MMSKLFFTCVPYWYTAVTAASVTLVNRLLPRMASTASIECYFVISILWYLHLHCRQPHFTKQGVSLAS